MNRRPGRARDRRAERQAPRPRAEAVGVVTIDRIAAGGDGVGRLDGLVIFVPRTAPGDVVQVAYVAHARHARGRVLQLLQPSPVRVAPPCPHYEGDRCGGCQLQHLGEAAQQEARRHIVQETLVRIGRRQVPLPPLASDAQWGYRNRLTLTLKRRGGSWIGGLHPHDDPTRVFALETCLIAHPDLVQVWHSVRGLLRAGAPSLPSVPSLRLSIRRDEVEGDTPATVSLVLDGGTQWPEQDAFAAAVRVADARVRGVWWTPATDAPTELATPAPEYAPQAREALAFAQVNAGVAAELRRLVHLAVTSFSPTRVIDAYAGTGVLAARLAAEGTAVIAIEADRAGAGAAEARLGALGPDVASRTRVVCDLVEQALPAFGPGADVIVLNPPRRGVHADVTSWLEHPAQAGVRGLVYVSCDPATLARDLGRLPSWRIRAVHCFDMFPQTAHVETVCVLQRENA